MSVRELILASTIRVEERLCQQFTKRLKQPDAQRCFSLSWCEGTDPYTNTIGVDVDSVLTRRAQ